MAVGVYVEVPQELADLLVDDGFRRAGTKRGIDMVDGIQIATGVGANLVTILLARHQIPRFVKRLWAFARGRKSGGGAKLVIEVDGRRVAITLEHGHSDEPPEAMLRGMTALFEALTDRPEDGRGG
jgi:hypothetical protein